MSNLSEAEAQELRTYLSKNRDVFAMKASEMGCTKMITHTIELTDSIPFKEKCRPIPPSAYDELRTHLAELHSAGIITESNSPYCSNIVIARKRCGTLRLCVDYRRLNSRTKKDAYNIPRADTLIDSLKGSKYFASLDLFSGYHQVQVETKDQEKTAFSVGPLGFYEYVRMPFGLCNSPSSFQRLMEKVLEGLTMVTCAVYIDDIIVFGASREELYSRLTEVFQRLRAANLTLKPKKCSFFQDKVEFLGHIVSKDGVQCSTKHLEAVATWPEPKGISELQTYLGFTGFYRRFIPGYATVAQPMLKLLRGKEQGVERRQGKVRQKGQGTGQGRRSKKRYETVPWEWGEEQRSAFEKLKESLVSAPILVYPDYEKPFTLHVDASRKGLGGVLYQEREGKLRVVGYASRSLTGSEKNYTVHKLEFLALKWAITCKFHHYLYGNKFSVYTDHNPLVYVTSTAKLDANGHRWLAELSSFDFQIFYKPGKLNADADGLSRRPHPEVEEQQSSRVISQDVFREICALVSGDNEFAGVAESLGLSPSAVSCATHVSYPVSLDWKQEQSRDPDIEIVRELVSTGIQPSDRQRKKQSPVVLRLLSHWDTLSVKEGVLYKVSKVCDEKRDRVVIPKHKYQEVLSLIHDDMGHLGRDKTLSLAQERFFWIGLTRDVEYKVKSCKRCICAKSPNLPEKAPLVSIVTSRPMELVCMDFVGLESSKGGYQNILVLTDHFTRYACAIPTRNQEAKTVAKVLMDEFFVHYGIPERLHSDQGANFQGRVITHLCQMLGIKKSRTTIYHPQGDGMTERFNRTLISMLKTLDPSLKPNWKEHVSSLVHAYNSTKHDSTGYSPFYLMFGRSPRLPIDVFLGLDHQYTSTLEDVKQRLDVAYKAAAEAARKASGKQKEGYDLKVRGQGLKAGDSVLLKNIGLKGKQKIADKWQSDVFEVVSQPNPDIPVYKIKRGSVVKTIHRNLLLPVVFPVSDSVAMPCSRVKKPSSKVANYDSFSDRSESEDSNLSFTVDFHVPVSIPIVDSPQAHHRVQLSGESFSGIDQRELSPTGEVVSPSGEESILYDNFEVSSDRDFVEAQSGDGHLLKEGSEGGEVLAASQDVVPELIPEAEGSSHARTPDVPEEHEVRRSSRTRQKPVWHHDFAMTRSQNVVFYDWRDRVSILVTLIDVFPSCKVQIFDAIIQIMLH